jgi:hypothetical protein
MTEALAPEEIRLRGRGFWERLFLTATCDTGLCSNCSTLPWPAEDQELPSFTAKTNLSEAGDSS